MRCIWIVGLMFEEDVIRNASRLGRLLNEQLIHKFLYLQAVEILTGRPKTRSAEPKKGAELHKVYQFVSWNISIYGKLGYMVWNLFIESDNFKEIYDRWSGLQHWNLLLCFSLASNVFSELLLNSLLCQLIMCHKTLILVWV